MDVEQFKLLRLQSQHLLSGTDARSVVSGMIGFDGRKFFDIIEPDPLQAMFRTRR